MWLILLVIWNGVYVLCCDVLLMLSIFSSGLLFVVLFVVLLVVSGVVWMIR